MKTARRSVKPTTARQGRGHRVARWFRLKSPGRRSDWPRNTARHDFEDLAGGHCWQSGSQLDVVLSYCEVNNRYGTGILIQRMFPQHCENVLSVRSVSIWQGEQEFGVRQLVLPPGLDRPGIYTWVLSHTSKFTLRHIYCIPFTSREIIAALAFRDAFQAPFCLYIMDDQNIDADAIPDDLMGEAIDKATLRLAISSDMRDAYQTKYNRKFWIAPPTMSNQPMPRRTDRRPASGVLVGNISAKEWLDALLGAVRGSALEIDWYANSPGGGFWLGPASVEALDAAGITMREPLPESLLAARLSRYEVALVPTMPRWGRHENRAIASLSFPSRVTFLVVTSDLPIIVLGDPASYVARLVDHYGLGVNCPYEAALLDQALAITRDESWRRRQSASLARMRRLLGGVDIASWLPAALVHGAPIDTVFESLEVRPRRFNPRYLDQTRPLGPWLHDYDAVYAAFRRMALAGYAPDFVIDAAASTRGWSHAVSRVFPCARFLLVEPPPCSYAPGETLFHSGTVRYEVRRYVLGESDGEGLMAVEPRPDGLSFPPDCAARSPERRPVRIKTLDSLASELGLVGRGVLRLDDRGRNVDILRGAGNLLATSVDAVVLNINVDPRSSTSSGDDEVGRFLGGLGFTFFDEVGARRDPGSGRLVGRDVLFVQRDKYAAGETARDDDANG